MNKKLLNIKKYSSVGLNTGSRKLNKYLYMNSTSYKSVWRSLQQVTVVQAEFVYKFPLLGIFFSIVTLEALSPSGFPLVQRYSISSEFLGWSMGTM